MLDPHGALIFTMVIVSAADRDHCTTSSRVISAAWATTWSASPSSTESSRHAEASASSVAKAPDAVPPSTIERTSACHSRLRRRDTR